MRSTIFFIYILVCFLIVGIHSQFDDQAAKLASADHLNGIISDEDTLRSFKQQMETWLEQYPVNIQPDQKN